MIIITSRRSENNKKVNVSIIKIENNCEPRQKNSAINHKKKTDERKNGHVIYNMRVILSLMKSFLSNSYFLHNNSKISKKIQYDFFNCTVKL